MNQPVNNQPNEARALRQTLARTVALLILVVHQAGAGVVCFCRSELGAQHSVTQIAHGSVAQKQHSCHAEAADIEAAHRIKATSVPAEQQSRGPTGLIAPCCKVHAQAEYQAVSAERRLPIPTFAQLTPVLADNTVKPALRPERDYGPVRARPLYLTQSCYLI